MFMNYQPFYGFSQNNQNRQNNRNQFSTLDFKRGDVNGDGIPDTVYIIGTKSPNPNSPFVDNIMIVVQDGRTKRFMQIPLKDRAGYEPKLFLGDFTGNGVDDIMVSIATGGSGGIYYYDIYSFLNNQPQKIFDSDVFYKENPVTVTYRDNYKVEVLNTKTNQVYIIDISHREPEYLAEIYDSNGKLKKPLTGDIDPLSGLYPIDFNLDGIYELFGVQRIYGRYHADGLGDLQTDLKFSNGRFFPVTQRVAIFGSGI